MKIDLLPLLRLLSNIIFLLKIFLQKLVLDGNIETRYADFLNSIKDKVNPPMVSANGKWYWFVNISLFHNIHSLKIPSILFFQANVIVTFNRSHETTTIHLFQKFWIKDCLSLGLLFVIDTKSPFSVSIVSETFITYGFVGRSSSCCLSSPG